MSLLSKSPWEGSTLLKEGRNDWPQFLLLDMCICTPTWSICSLYSKAVIFINCRITATNAFIDAQDQHLPAFILLKHVAQRDRSDSFMQLSPLGRSCIQHGPAHDSFSSVKITDHVLFFARKLSLLLNLLAIPLSRAVKPDGLNCFLPTHTSACGRHKSSSVCS